MEQQQATSQIKHPWVLFDNDYDEIWDLIFELDGITPEEEIGFDPDLDGDEEWAM